VGLQGILGLVGLLAIAGGLLILRRRQSFR